MSDIASDITVHISRWADRFGERFSVIYEDEKGQRYTPATRPTEFEARQFAHRHGWTVSDVRSEAAS